MPASWKGLVIAWLLMLTSTVHAHGMRSGYLEIDEVEGADPLVRLRVTQPELVATPSIVGCTLTALSGTSVDIDGLSRSYRARCTGGLAGASIAITGLGIDLEEAVVRVVTRDGDVHAGVLTAANPRMVVPRSEDAAAAMTRYLSLGVDHILGGLDHLLFLLLIVLHLRRPRSIVVVETAFSLSHGIAFAATATGWIQVPAAPVEACIALSLVLLALEVGNPALTTRTTAALALVFGAVHGLGFAGGLRELGVPEAHLAPALLGFGLGVEIGQLLFVLAAWTVLSLGMRWRLRSSERAFRWVVLVCGSLATSWLFSRGLAALEGTI